MYLVTVKFSGFFATFLKVAKTWLHDKRKSFIISCLEGQLNKFSNLRRLNITPFACQSTCHRKTFYNKFQSRFLLGNLSCEKVLWRESYEDTKTINSVLPFQLSTNKPSSYMFLSTLSFVVVQRPQTYPGVFSTGGQ